MANGGFIAAGLLGGLGKGLSMQAEQMREDALERLRASRQVDAENRAETRDIAGEDRKEGRTIAGEDRAEKRTIAAEGREFEYKKGLLGATAGYKAAEDARDLDAKIKIEGVKHLNDRDLETLKARNARSLEAFEQAGRITLEEKKAALDTIEEQRKEGKLVVRTEINETGQIFGVTADGNTVALQGVRKDGSRGMLKARPQRGSEGDDDYLPSSLRGASNRPDTSSRSAPREPEAKAAPKPSGTPIAPQDVANLYNEATAKAASGAAGYKGLSATQLKAKVDAMLRAQGYAI